MQDAIEIQEVVKLPHKPPFRDKPPPNALSKNARREYITTEKAQK